MTETALLVLIAIMVAAVLVMAVSVAMTTRELRHTLRRLNALLPLIEDTVHRVCGTVDGLIDGLDFVRARVRTFFGARRENGVGAGPHRSSRRRTEARGG